MSLLLIIASVLKISAQSDPLSYALSPSAAELGSYGQVPLGLFTGTPEINVPLYELKTRNLSLPISLNYRSNGFLVNKVSSNVGFDWSLFAGGAITRIVKGYPDAHQIYSNATYPIDPQKPLSQLTEEDKADLENFFFWRWDNQTDTQPDLFAYNFAGYSGQFYIDDGHQAITIPYQKLKIEMAGPIFTITAPDGVIYEFKAY